MSQGRYRVSSTDLRLTLNETDKTAAILQNIAIILRTRRGTVPLYRDFGLSQTVLDKPVSVVRPLLLREIKEAVEEFEPRARIVNVTLAEDPASPGRINPVVEVDIIG